MEFPNEVETNYDTSHNFMSLPRKWRNFHCEKDWMDMALTEIFKFVGYGGGHFVAAKHWVYLVFS